MSKRFVLTITLNNAAMQTPANIAEALRGLARRMESGRTAGDPSEPIAPRACIKVAGNVIDGNGNTVGEWKVTR